MNFIKSFLKTIFKNYLIFGFILIMNPIIHLAQAQDSYLMTRHLRTEYLHNPLGIDISHPRFSWQIESFKRDVNQSAYQIEVASNISNLLSNQPDIWNSTKKESDQSFNVSFSGKPLASDQTYYWRVKIWDQNGVASSWSKINYFHTGLFNKKDWQGEWIGDRDSTVSSPLLRKEFDLTKKIKSAYAFVSGLGYYELYLNGKKVGNHVLDPGTSDYNRRALYVTYNVTNYLQSGANAVGLWLGNAYFKTNRDRPFRFYGHQPQAILQLNIEYTDGSKTQIVTNTTWKASDSPIRENNIYDGEVYDANREKKGWDLPGYNASWWKNAIAIQPPSSRVLSAQLMPPIKVEKTLFAKTMTQPLKNIYVFDFGQNFSGWPVLKVNAGSGNRIVMKTAEITRKDMVTMQGGTTTGIVDTIDAVENRSAKARDIYIAAGKPGIETYNPRFTYQGFRYVQLEGYPGKPNITDLTADFVHSNVTKVGEFHCSNPLFNQIHQNILWGQQSNLMSMPTDCDQRNERMGWMADADLSAEEAVHNFDMSAFYTNWIREIQDEQHPDGSVPDIVPDHKWLQGTYRGTPAWQSAYPLLVWYVHHYYGDNRIIEEHYESLAKWMGYMKSISHNFIISSGRGDWVPPKRGGPMSGGVPITSTGYYYKSAVLMSKMATIMGKSKDRKYYSDLAKNIKKAFNERFWNASKECYGNGSQTNNAFALYAGVVPESRQQIVIKDLRNNILLKHDGHLWTGILGTKALIEVLPEYHQTALLDKMVNQTTFPGWGYMISRGATTLWERWGGYRYFGPGMNSLNHIMFGSIDEFFYRDIAGIRLSESGYRKILIHPHDIGKLRFAKGSIKTILGKVASEWYKTKNQISLKVTIPVNSQAEIDIPKSNITGPYTVHEGNYVIWQAGTFKRGDSGIKDVKSTVHYIHVTAGSGTYSFTLSGMN